MSRVKIFVFKVPFGIDRNVGKIGLVKDVGSGALDEYFLRVQVESESGDLASTEIQIVLTGGGGEAGDGGDRPTQFRLSVKENLEGALVANLSHYLRYFRLTYPCVNTRTKYILMLDSTSPRLPPTSPSASTSSWTTRRPGASSASPTAGCSSPRSELSSGWPDLGFL